MSGTAIDLYVIVERSVFETDRTWLAALAKLAELDVPGFALQVRTKEQTAARAAALATEAGHALGSSIAPAFLNGDARLASELGYDGVHWPEVLIPDSPPATSNLLKGASVHSTAASRKAETAGADFVVAGTVFDAGSKPVRGTGLPALSEIAGSSRLPVLAVGGVKPERVAACIAAGASGVAVVTAVLLKHDMGAAVLAFREALDEARSGRTAAVQ